MRDGLADQEGLALSSAIIVGGQVGASQCIADQASFDAPLTVGRPWSMICRITCLRKEIGRQLNGGSEWESKPYQR